MPISVAQGRTKVETGLWHRIHLTRAGRMVGMPVRGPRSTTSPPGPASDGGRGARSRGHGGEVEGALPIQNPSWSDIILRVARCTGATALDNKIWCFQGTGFSCTTALLRCILRVAHAAQQVDRSAPAERSIPGWLPRCRARPRAQEKRSHLGAALVPDPSGPIRGLVVGR